MTKKDWLHVYDLVGAAMEVFNELGRGLEEAIYQEALAMELSLRNIPFEREKKLCLHYKGLPMQKYYMADLYSDGVLIELKSVWRLAPEHRAQLFNYMQITDTALGLLINYGEESLRCERYLYLPEEDDFVLLTKENYLSYISN